MLYTESTWLDIGPTGPVLTDSNSWNDIPPATYWFIRETAYKTKFVHITKLRKQNLPDLVIPITSIQIRRRNGLPTFALVVIPNAPVWINKVQQYQDGEIIIEAGLEDDAGVRNLTELTRVALEQISFDQGPRSASISISGHRTFQTTNPRLITLGPVHSYSLQADGRRRVRCALSIFLRPGDMGWFRVSHTDIDYITAESISVMIDRHVQRMDITGY